MSTHDHSILAHRTGPRKAFSRHPPPGWINKFSWPRLDKDTPQPPGHGLNVHDCWMEYASLYLYADGTFYFEAYWSGKTGDVWIIRRFSCVDEQGGQVGHDTPQYDAPAAIPPGFGGNDFEWIFSDKIPGITATNSGLVAGVSMTPHC
jgi:hypothetical protein